MSDKDDKILKSFQVFVPVELVKSDASVSDDEAEDSWKIQGVASTDDVDLQGEEVLQDGLDIEVLKAGRGLFNNDHLKGPENILGQIDDADFIEYNGKKALLVKGYLFKHQPRAQAYYNIMRSVRKGSSSRVHYSIEGKVVERDMVNSGRIRKARIDKVALTLDPVNPYTFAELAKSLAAENKTIHEEDFFADVLEYLNEILPAKVEKALAAGAGYSKSPESRTGGEAMSTESMDSSVKCMSSKKKKKLKKAILEAIFSKLGKK